MEESFILRYILVLLVLSLKSEATVSNRLRDKRSTGWIWTSDAQDKAPENVGNPGIEPRYGVPWLGSYSTPSTPVPLPTTTASNNCTCVPYYYCDESQIVDGTGTIDIRLGWPCKSILEVCCRRPVYPTTTVATPITTTSASGTTAIPGYAPKCGSLNPNGINARILGFKDSESQFGEYPWMAAVLEWKIVNGQKVLQFVCGGALIWPSVVITAAHCLKGKRADHLTIRLGEWDTQTTMEFYPHQDIYGKEIVIHPNYYGGALYYDVGLVFLTRSAVLAPHIDTICLPPSYVNYDNISCWATGWGKNQFGKSGSYQVILKEVELPVTPTSTCQASLQKTSLGPNFKLHESFLCAGGLKGIDTCIGDGGGGLVCASTVDPWRFVLAGIVSWGVGCGTYGLPGVYVDVTKVRSWIDTTISLRIPTYDTDRVTVTSSGNQYG